MRVKRFTGRDRRIPGRTTGSVECVLVFPLSDERYGLRPLGRHAIENIRKFILKHLADRQAIMDGAYFTLYAEMRAATGSLYRSKLVNWQHGEDLDAAFLQASTRWNQIEVEEDYSSYEADLDLP